MDTQSLDRFHKISEALGTLRWSGDTPEIITAVPAIAYSARRYTPEECEFADMFFRGEQWEYNIYTRRLSEGRPCLVINRLPALLDIAVSKSIPGEFDNLELEIARVDITFRNMDAQRAYNWQYSKLVEMMGSL